MGTSEVMLARSEVAPGKAEKLRTWFEELHEREAEVIETLRHEGVYAETALLRSNEGATYLYVYRGAEDLDRADEAGDEEAYEIDENHHAVLRDTLTGGRERLETFGHFTNPSLR